MLFRLIIYSINWKILWKRYLLILGVCTNLLVLMYFKYYNFFIGTMNIFGQKQFSTKDIVAPLGVSFLVFQQIAFLVDASRNEIKKCSLIEYCTYVLFFPHVSSGPILLHNDLMPLLRSVRKVDWGNIASGIYLFVMGLGKKVLIADMLAEAVDWGYANLEGINSTSAIWITILYTLPDTNIKVYSPHISMTISRHIERQDLSLIIQRIGYTVLTGIAFHTKLMKLYLQKHFMISGVKNTILKQRLRKIIASRH